MLETLDYTIRIGSTPTFLYFDLTFKKVWDIFLQFLSKFEKGIVVAEFQRD